MIILSSMLKGVAAGAGTAIGAALGNGMGAFWTVPLTSHYRGRGPRQSFESI
jgi:hypothetical protein